MKSLCLLLAAVLLQGETAPGDLRIVVVTGEGAVNNVRRKLMSPVEVEVRDERNRPVEGARVRFSLPAIGPGGRFADGNATAETISDGRGRASISPFVPNEQEGRFSLVVNAISKGREAGASISQMNSRYLVPAPSRGLDMRSTRQRGSRTMGIVLGVGAAAAVAGVVAIKGGGRTTAVPGAAAAPPVGISVGGISVGGPQ